MEVVLFLMILVEILAILVSGVMALLKKGPLGGRVAWKSIVKWGLGVLWITFQAWMFTVSMDAGIGWLILSFLIGLPIMIFLAIRAVMNRNRRLSKPLILQPVPPPGPVVQQPYMQQPAVMPPGAPQPFMHQPGALPPIEQPASAVQGYEPAPMPVQNPPASWIQPQPAAVHDGGVPVPSYNPAVNPITGQTPAPRPRRWPFALAAGALICAALVTIVYIGLRDDTTALTRDINTISDQIDEAVSSEPQVIPAGTPTGDLLPASVTDYTVEKQEINASTEDYGNAEEVSYLILRPAVSNPGLAQIDQARLSVIKYGSDHKSLGKGDDVTYGQGSHRVYSEVKNLEQGTVQQTDTETPVYWQFAQQDIGDYSFEIRLVLKDGLAGDTKIGGYNDNPYAYLMLAYLDKILEVNPDYAKAYQYEASSFYTIGNYQQVEQKARAGIEKDPQNAELYNLLGLTLGHMGDYQGAHEAYTRAIEIEPNATIYCNRGANYFNLGQYENAVKDLDQALAGEQKESLAYYFRSLAYYKLGNHDAALADMQEAAKLAPDDAQIQEDLAILSSQ